MSFRSAKESCCGQHVGLRGARGWRAVLWLFIATSSATCAAAAVDERVFFVPTPGVGEVTGLESPAPHVAGALAGEAVFLGEKDAPQPAANPATADLLRRIAELDNNIQQLNAEREAARKKAAETMSVNVRGHILFDAAAFSQDTADKLRYDEQNGFTSRVGRLFFEGTGADVMSYRVEFEFARLYVEDLWLGISHLPYLGNIRIGHVKEPFSLEQIGSRKYYTFMERSVAEFIHTPPRRVGIMAFDTAASERVTWAAGLFSDAPGINFVQDDDFGGAFTARVTWLPWYDEATQGRGLLHTGIAYSYREPFGSSLRFRARPESFLASYAVDTGKIPADSTDLLGTEVALVYGPFSAQSEYILGIVDAKGAPNASLQGTYVLLSYFLTGESRNYLKSQAVFGQIKPLENFLRVRTEEGSVQRGKGAWELRYRYSYLDAWDSGKLSAGRIGNHGVGVNWYLNPFTRVMAEYIYSKISRPETSSDGHLHIFQMRTQIEF